MQAGQWTPDPSGRHAQRYYDGTRWTEHVIDRMGRLSGLLIGAIVTGLWVLYAILVIGVVATA